MTLEQALAYLTPHPRTNGPVQLTPAKMREAIAVITGTIDEMKNDLELAASDRFERDMKD